MIGVETLQACSTLHRGWQNYHESIHIEGCSILKFNYTIAYHPPCSSLISNLLQVCSAVRIKHFFVDGAWLMPESLVSLSQFVHYLSQKNQNDSFFP